jgi:uncharacterized MnhB-related membrane protein
VNRKLNSEMIKFLIAVLMVLIAITIHETRALLSWILVAGSVVIVYNVLVSTFRKKI